MLGGALAAVGIWSSGVASAAGALVDAAVPCPAEGMMPIRGSATHAVRVEHFDRAALTIRGVGLPEHRRTVIRMCGSARVDDHPAAEAKIGPGDLVYAYEVPTAAGLVATTLGVNTYTAYVRIRGVSGRRLAFVAVDARTLRPISTQFPGYLGELPAEGIVGAATTVSDAGRIVPTRRIAAGRYAKIYGQKRPGARTVVLRQVELLRGR